MQNYVEYGKYYHKKSKRNKKTKQKQFWIKNKKEKKKNDGCFPSDAKGFVDETAAETCTKETT